MEKKTIEQMRSSVLAYCEEVCKGIEPCRPVDVRGPIHVADYLDRFVIREWLSKDGKRYANAHLTDVFKDGDFDPTIAYALLGLEACHDVAYEKARLLKRYKARIKRLRSDDAETHRIQIEVKDERIAALESRNAALVAALERIKKEYGLEHGVLRGERPVINSLGEFINEALSTNTEKGGVQG